jgi:hypothetical protein
MLIFLSALLIISNLIIMSFSGETYSYWSEFQDTPFHLSSFLAKNISLVFITITITLFSTLLRFLPSELNKKLIDSFLVFSILGILTNGEILFSYVLFTKHVSLQYLDQYSFAYIPYLMFGLTLFLIDYSGLRKSDKINFDKLKFLISIPLLFTLFQLTKINYPYEYIKKCEELLIGTCTEESMDHTISLVFIIFGMIYSYILKIIFLKKESLPESTVKK